MESTVEKQKGTLKFMEGEWKHEYVNNGKSEKLYILISRDKCRFIKSIEGMERENFEFSGNAHWFGPWLCFLYSKKHFYVSYADSINLDFGEYDGLNIGPHKWQFSFVRANQN